MGLWALKKELDQRAEDMGIKEFEEWLEYARLPVFGINAPPPETEDVFSYDDQFLLLSGGDSPSCLRIRPRDDVCDNSDNINHADE